MLETKLFIGGQKKIKVDDKNRIVIPLSARNVISKRQEGVQEEFKDIIFLSNIQNIYVCFVANDYLERYPEMLKRHWTDEERTAFFSAEMQKIDKQGRTRVPPLYEGEKEIIYIPNGDCFNIGKVE